MPFIALIFINPMMVQRHYMEIFCIKFHPKQSRNTEIAGNFTDTCMERMTVIVLMSQNSHLLKNFL